MKFNAVKMSKYFTRLKQWQWRKRNFRNTQECIPVGCVPAARRPYAAVCFRGGGGESGSAWSGGVSAWWSGGGLPGPGGWSAWSGGGVCLVSGGGLPGGPRGCLPGLGGGLPDSRGRGGLVSQHALRQTPPRGQTDTCKNITLATTSLRPVKRGANPFDAIATA